MCVTAKESNFYRILIRKKLTWFEVAAHKRELEEEIERYEDAAVLVALGKDPVYALLTVDSYYGTKSRPDSDAAEIAKLHLELEAL